MSTGLVIILLVYALCISIAMSFSQWATLRIKNETIALCEEIIENQRVACSLLEKHRDQLLARNKRLEEEIDRQDDYIAELEFTAGVEEEEEEEEENA